MPTVLSHPAVPLAIGLAAGRSAVSRRLLLVGALCSSLPDIDTLGYWAGIPYGQLLGHRGLTHSIFFACVVAGIASLAAPVLASTAKWSFGFVFISTASHGLLDTLTDGGRGIALLSPFSNHRYFAPWRPIPVSPIGVSGPSRMLSLLAAELVLLWVPLLALATVGYAWRRLRVARSSS